MPAFEVRLITAEETLPLRHPILRAGLPRETAIFPGDEAESSRPRLQVSEPVVRWRRLAAEAEHRDCRRDNGTKVRRRGRLGADRNGGRAAVLSLETQIKKGRASARPFFIGPSKRLPLDCPGGAIDASAGGVVQPPRGMRSVRLWRHPPVRAQER